MNRVLSSMLALFLSLNAFAGSLSVTVRAEPPSALPGIPVRLIMSVENTSDQVQAVPLFMVVRARSQSESSEWVLLAGNPDVLVRELPEEYMEARTLAPHQSRVYEIPLAWQLVLGTGVLGDPRLWTPGTYDLQLILNDDLMTNEIVHFGIDGLLGAGRIRSPLVVSSVASLRIETPTGTDAEVWSEILRRTEGRGLLRTAMDQAEKIVRDLWARPDESAYTPYLPGFIVRSNDEERERICKHIIERYPTHIVAEQMRLGMAATLALRAQTDLMHGADLDTVLIQTDEARAALMKLQKDAQSDLDRVRATQELAKIKSRERLIEMYRELVVKR